MHGMPGNRMFGTPCKDKYGRKRAINEDTLTEVVCTCGSHMSETTVAEEDFDEMTDGQKADFDAGFQKVYLCTTCWDVAWVKTSV